MATALLSVCDKTGIVEFAKELKSLGYDVIDLGAYNTVTLEKE